jgi:hypothetical protein
MLPGESGKSVAVGRVQDGLDRLGAVSARRAAIDGTMHEDTWQWAGGEWKKLEEIRPAPRIQHAIAFDTNQSRLVLFGGQDAHRMFADTWEAPIREPGPPP